VPSAAVPSATTVAQRASNITAFVQSEKAYGSGIVISRRGHVLTCWHVVSDGVDLTVELANGGRDGARSVDRDVALDLAVLELIPTASGMPDLDFDAEVLGSAVSTRVGDEIYAMGAPYKMSFTLTRGMVSFVGRAFDGVHFLQTDAATNAGNSGGPVLNAEGDVIAISSFILRQSTGLAFALPLDYARRRFPKYFGVDANGAGAEFDAWLSARRAPP
jgi:serine protease Do